MTTKMPVSAIIGFGGVAIGCMIGAVLGCIAALKNKGFVDYFVIVLAILGVSVPNFVFGSLIQRYFAVELKMFPIQGWKGWEEKEWAREDIAMRIRYTTTKEQPPISKTGEKPVRAAMMTQHRQNF